MVKPAVVLVDAANINERRKDEFKSFVPQQDRTRKLFKKPATRKNGRKQIWSCDHFEDCIHHLEEAVPGAVIICFFDGYSVEGFDRTASTNDKERLIEAWSREDHVNGKILEVPKEFKADHPLVELAQNGDKKAFDLLVIKYRGRLIRLLSRFIRDSTEVEDVAQETFIKAYLALSSFRGESAFYTWLYRVGINTAKNFLTIRGREVIDRNITYDISDSECLETNNRFQDWKTPERELINKQLAQTIKRALENLPKELYTTITLREIEGLSYEEIANVMSCPIGTVRSRIFRARDLILSELEPILADK